MRGILAMVPSGLPGSATRLPRAFGPLGDAPVYDWGQLRRRWREPLWAGNLSIDMFRHGETETNSKGLVSGHSDTALTPRGLKQAHDLGQQLVPPYGHAFCSTLGRSQVTLRAAMESGGLSVEATIDSRLDERSLGVMEGKPSTHIPELASGDLDYAPVNGETYRQVAQKCLSFLLDLSHLAASISPPHFLVSTHMGPMRILHGIFTAADSPRTVTNLKFENAKLFRYQLASPPWPSFLEVE